jgi:hypothetical protein
MDLPAPENAPGLRENDGALNVLPAEYVLPLPCMPYDLLP